MSTTNDILILLKEATNATNPKRDVESIQFCLHLVSEIEGGRVAILDLDATANGQIVPMPAIESTPHFRLEILKLAVGIAQTTRLSSVQEWFDHFIEIVNETDAERAERLKEDEQKEDPS